ncbi:mediator of RNA polymerase II transcription subunit 31-like isoform X3 [Homarus americanus]|uniref:mediator of RNA polymerase II transcription subunit 31-like isoform X3 n=1 Tax=Homarus americanus TaxID=6706 RepID=UPI001C436D39|nr:mediator of RNA polymerase II transcription subunit 31-like isoform X3 [Homarus americanus]
MPRMSRKSSYSYHGVNEGESEDAQRVRFQIELEFVQCLANPNYLLFLAQRGYFKEQTFINYLKYLQYWKEPEYAKYLKYPMCLYFLDLLQHENFRKEIVNGQCCKFIDDQTVLHWQHYSRKRMKLLETGINQQGSQTPVSQSTVSQSGAPTPAALATNLLNGHGQIQKV